MHAVSAKWFIENLRRETKKGLTEKAEQGGWPSKAPLGYRNVGETIGRKPRRYIEVYEPEARLVRRMFELYATGNYPLTALRQLAIDVGVVGRRSGRTLTRSEVSRILKNPIYYGEFRWSGRFFPGTHTPIISRELFDMVQEKLEERRQRPLGKRLSFPFSGIFTCGHCGCALSAERHVKRSGRVHVYYRCSQARGKCPQPFLKEQAVEQVAEGTVKAVEISADDLDLLRQTLHKNRADEQAYYETQTMGLEARDQALQRRLDKAYEDKLDGVITPAEWTHRTEQWRAEQDEIKRKLALYRQADRTYVDEGVKFFEFAHQAHALYVAGTAEERREILRSLLSNCPLTDATPSPSYRKPWCWLVNLNEMKKRGPLSDSASNRGRLALSVTAQATYAGTMRWRRLASNRPT